MKTIHSVPVLRVRTVIPFVLLTFGLSWGIIALYVLAPEMMNPTFGKISGVHPLFFIAIYSPSIAAIALVAGRTGTPIQRPARRSWRSIRSS